MTERIQLLAYKYTEILDFIDSIIQAYTYSSQSKQIIDISKRHFIYLKEDLKKINGEGVGYYLIEIDYYDADYGEDFSEHYSRCFIPDYGPFCLRIHFFSKAIEIVASRFILQYTCKCNVKLPETELPDELAEETCNFLLELFCGYQPVAEVVSQARDNNTSLETHIGYLGFMVIKPLPQAFIGRTCIKPYSKVVEGETRKRFYPVLRKYTVNLQGIKMQVTSLAYQEQDKVVAACATAALWSAFQATSTLFGHPILTPVEITHSNGIDTYSAKRSVPSSGLNVIQVAQAARSVGLEPEMFEPQTTRQLAAICSAYNRCGIPVIALLPMTNNAKVEIRPYDKGPIQSTMEGNHAICIVGYSWDESEFVTDPSYYKANQQEHGLRLLAHSCQRLYAHDDQIGPFSRLEIDHRMIRFPINYQHCDEKHTPYSLVDSVKNMWCKEDKSKESRFGCGAIVVPVDRLIRINYYAFLDLIVRFDSYLKDASGLMQIDPASICWDIYLTRSEHYKRHLREVLESSPEVLSDALQIHLPKYTWIAAMYYQANQTNKPAHKYDFLFDATASHLGDYYLYHVDYKPNLVPGMLMGLVEGKTGLVSEADVQLKAMFKSVLRNSIFASAIST